MSNPPSRRLVIKQGATFERWWRLRDKSTGQTLDLANTGDGYDIGVLKIRDQYGGDEILTLSTANGGVVISYQQDADGVFWSGFWLMSASATALLVPWGEGVWDFEISNGVHEFPVSDGEAVLRPTTIT